MRLSLFTVSFAGFWGQDRLSLDECIDAAADLGFEGIELMGKRPHLSPLDYSPEQCVLLRKHLDRRGLKASAIAAYTNFTGGMESAEVPFRDMQVAYVEELCRRAEVLGCPLVRIFTSYERNDLPFHGQWSRTIDAIRECCDRAVPFGVTIGVQNHHDIGVTTPSLRELLAQINRPNVIPMYDCWSAFLLGEDAAKGAACMVPHMRFTTVADYRILPRARYRPELVNYDKVDPPFVMAVPMGEGDLPYQSFFDSLSRGGFDGWVSYEMCSPLRDGGARVSLERYAKQFIEYMKPWTGKGQR